MGVRKERVEKGLGGGAVFGEVLGAEAGEAISLVVAWDAGVSWNPAGLDDEGGTGEHGEYLLKEVAEFGVVAEAFTENVDTDLAVRKDDTKAGWGSLGGSKKVRDGHTDRPGFTKVVGTVAEAGRQPNGREPRLHDEGARS